MVFIFGCYFVFIESPQPLHYLKCDDTFKYSVPVCFDLFKAFLSFTKNQNTHAMNQKPICKY